MRILDPLLKLIELKEEVVGMSSKSKSSKYLVYKVTGYWKMSVKYTSETGTLQNSMVI